MNPPDSPLGFRPSSLAWTLLLALGLALMSYLIWLNNAPTARMLQQAARDVQISPIDHQ